MIVEGDTEIVLLLFALPTLPKSHHALNQKGTTVTAIDAHHCPGAVMLVFEPPAGGDGDSSGARGRTVLHSGDMRACDALLAHPLLAARCRGCELFLDTT